MIWLILSLWTIANIVIAAALLLRPSRAFDSAVPHKGGHNDLSRWQAFGGSLKRPDPPLKLPPLPQGSLKRRQS